MIRRAGLACLLAACAQAPQPAVTIYGVIDGREPIVRVHLRSLGTWDALPVEGKGGLRVSEAGARFATEEPVKLARSQERMVFEPLEGVFTVAGHAYSGRLTWEDGYLVNLVPLESYVLGVLRGELPLKEVPRSAAAAQAIAARSYALHYLAQARPHFDVDDTTLFQRYVGRRQAPDDRSLRAGVQSTTGLYLDYRGRPLKAYYHSTCGGHTADVPTGLDRAPVAPLSGVPCDHCRASKYYRWEVRLADAEILRATPLRGALQSLEVCERGPGGRAYRVRIEAEGESILHASELRMALGPSKLRSTHLLELTRVEGGYAVKGAGWGHGVGLCQMGAIGLAREGRSGDEIAAYYYPGATIRRAY
ncbi:MAG: SpoIID/LytB domain-containing protein [Planctomycetota bacterium]